jgi:glycosyltransferase involved in cell wall biosynthesis
MGSDLFFSVIIPSYNRGGFIQRAVQSVLDQTYPEFEVVVVDDGSTDNTRQIVSDMAHRNPDRIRYVHQANSERAAARNNGLLHAKGDYVVFFDSDDLLYSNYLSLACESILQHDKPEFVHFRYDIKNKDLEVIRQSPVLKERPNKKLIEGNFLSCKVILRKDIALQNRFNEDRALSGLEDWELWLRLAVKCPIIYENAVTSALIEHDDRSVLVIDKDALVLRVDTLLFYVLSNKDIIAYYGSAIKKFESSCFSYIALHLALTGKHKGLTIHYLTKSLAASPLSIFKKRFFAILKRLI